MIVKKSESEKPDKELFPGRSLSIDIQKFPAIVCLMKRLIAVTLGAISLPGLQSCGVRESPPEASFRLSPTAWLAETLARRDPSPSQPNAGQAPILLIHGIDGSGRDMARLARALRATGRTVHLIDLVPNDGSATIEALSGQLEAFVTARLPATAPFDIAAYSMGGIVARHYLQERGGHTRVRRFVSISSPHHGTLVAWLRRKTGARQMRVGSEFLEQLADPESLARLPPTTSFQTVTDLVIVPFTSSTLPGARNIRLFGWGHFTGIIQRHALLRIVDECNRP